MLGDQNRSLPLGQALPAFQLRTILSEVALPVAIDKLNRRASSLDCDICRSQSKVNGLSTNLIDWVGAEASSGYHGPTRVFVSAVPVI